MNETESAILRLLLLAANPDRRYTSNDQAQEQAFNFLVNAGILNGDEHTLTEWFRNEHPNVIYRLSEMGMELAVSHK